jgi:hypothetical protein
VHKVLDYENANILTARGNNQTTKQVTKVYTTRTVTRGGGGRPKSVVKEIENRTYPLFIEVNLTECDGKFNFDTVVDHGLEISTSVVTLKHKRKKSLHLIDLKTRQVGGGNFGNLYTTSVAFQNQTYKLKTPMQCYIRNVGAYDRKLVYDNTHYC